MVLENLSPFAPFHQEGQEGLGDLVVRYILEGQRDLVDLAILVNLVFQGIQEILFHLSTGSQEHGPVFHQGLPSFLVTLVVQDFQRIQANLGAPEALVHPLSRCILEYLEDLVGRLGQEYQEVLGFQGNPMLQEVLLCLLFLAILVLQYHPFVLVVHVAPQVLAFPETQ